jgi:hypothetical protein
MEGMFEIRKAESGHLRYVALTGLACFLLVSRASPFVEVFRPVGAGKGVKVNGDFGGW